PATTMPVGGIRRGSRWSANERRPVTREAIELPSVFPDPRDDRTIDIVVLGESSAEGVPYKYWVSIGGIIFWQLGELLPERPVRLRVLAMSGDTLERQHRKLEDVTRRPDIMIIYCGHNEFASRLDAARDPQYYLDDQLPTAWSLLVDWVEGTSALCHVI